MAALLHSCTVLPESPLRWLRRVTTRQPRQSRRWCRPANPRSTSRNPSEYPKKLLLALQKLPRCNCECFFCCRWPATSDRRAQCKDSNSYLPILTTGDEQLPHTPSKSPTYRWASLHATVLRQDPPTGRRRALLCHSSPRCCFYLRSTAG